MHVVKEDFINSLPNSTKIRIFSVKFGHIFTMKLSHVRVPNSVLIKAKPE